MKKHLILILVFLFCLTVYLSGIFLSEKLQPGKKDSSKIPQRVISINPAATEIIFELSSQNKLVAISNYCTYPPETKNIPKAGAEINPNFERIIALDPDLIIIMGKADEMIRFCNRRNIEHMNVNLRNIDEIYSGITQLGVKLGCEDEAQRLCKKIRDQLKEVENKVISAKKKKVFFTLYRTPGSLAGLSTVGPETLVSQLITIAGGTNIFSDLQQDYPMISKETLLKRQPDVIIEAYAPPEGEIPNPKEVMSDWSKLDNLNAVINNELYIIDADLVLKPGPRISQAVLELAKLIHPELFNE